MDGCELILSSSVVGRRRSEGDGSCFVRSSSSHEMMTCPILLLFILKDFLSRALER